MKKTNRFILFVVLCLTITILPSCRVRDMLAVSKRSSITLFPASVYEDNKIKWGYINKKGEFIIKPSFSRAEDFNERGFALAGTDEAVGIIDRAGKYIIEPKYNYIYPFSEGIAVADDTAGFKAINEKGQVIFQSNSYIGDFKDGMAYFSQQGTDGRYLYGYIDNLGNIVIQPQYENAGNFSDGKAVVKLGEDSYEIIDKSGKTISSFDYDYVNSLGEGLVAFKVEGEDKVGIMDESGRVVISPSFDYVEGFKNGLSVVSFSDENFNMKYGLINNIGEYIINPEYCEIRDLGEGLFAVGIPIDSEWTEMGSKYAIANSSGEFLTDFVYYGVGDFSEGLASVNDLTSTFFITAEGKRSELVNELEGVGELKLLGDIIKANIDNRLSYMDKQGKIIWKEGSEYNITREISVKEVKFRPNRNLLTYYPEITGLADKSIQDNLNKALKESYVYGEDYIIKPEDDLDFNYETDFDIKFYNKDLLNIEMTGYNYPFGAAHGMPVRGYDHIDLRTGRIYALKDLFVSGTDYVDRLNNIIRIRIDNNPDEYFPDAFEGISEEQFIITKDALVIYFAPYEIASYAQGFQEFEIKYEDIMDVINTDGELWKSFN